MVLVDRQHMALAHKRPKIKGVAKRRYNLASPSSRRRLLTSKSRKRTK